MRRVLLPLTLMLISALGFGQNTQNLQGCPCPVKSSIVMGGDGTYETDPDVAILTFTISTQEKKLPDAYGKAVKAADQFREALRANGIDPKDAQIGFFQIGPMYDYGKRRKTVGYGVQSKITLKVRDFSKIPPITDSLGNIESAGDMAVNYVVTDMEAAKNKAVENATRNARRNAESVVTTAGAKLGELLNAGTQTSSNVETRRNTYAFTQQAVEVTDGRSYSPPPAPTAEFGAGKVTITAHVNLEFAIAH